MTYSDELGEWIKQKPTRKHYKNLASYLAVKPLIHEALSNGYAVKTIWNHMYETKLIDFSYDTFLKYTKKLNLKKESVKTIKEEQKPITGFIFNKTPNKEDLL